MWQKGIIILLFPLITQASVIASVAFILSGSNALLEKAWQAPALSAQATTLTRGDMHLVMLACWYHVFHEPWLLEEFNKQKQSCAIDLFKLQQLPNTGTMNMRAVLDWSNAASVMSDKLIHTSDNKLVPTCIISRSLDEW